MAAEAARSRSSKGRRYPPQFGNRLTRIPDPSQAEVHLFGPGYGESILVHLGQGEWMIVDSCVDRKTGNPAALDYLQAIGVDPTNAVKLVVATHWHDDHIRGISRVLKACSDARFVLPQAMHSAQFLQLTALHSDRSLMRSGSGLDEFSAVAEDLQQRAKQGRRLGDGFSYAKADQRLWQGTSGGVTREIWSLAPSDAEFTAALKDIAQLLPETDGAIRKRVTPRRPNNFAIALWVELGALQILLGSDLEQVGFVDAGWTAVVNSTARPQGKASLCKVAHHGSSTAHNMDVWSKMLETPVAVLTPFWRGSTALPSEADVARIKSLASCVYTSMSRRGKRARSTNNVVARAFREGTRSIREAPATGRVSAHACMTGSAPVSWSIHASDGAAQL